jgi:uncharacterized damage-inducible protein DinB
MSDLGYPVGRFVPDSPPTPETRARHIGEIAALPPRLRQAVTGLNQEQLNTPYREGGWTVRELVHHVPDSHMNAYIRCKLALTEDVPTIKPYDQSAWANLPDTALTPVEVSLSLPEAIHARWVTLLRSLKAEDFKRQFHHPETGMQTVESTVAFYDWHSNHHLAHITSLRDRMGW